MKKIIITTIILLSTTYANAGNWFNFRKLYFNTGVGMYMDNRLGLKGAELSINCCGVMVDFATNPIDGINSADVGEWSADYLSSIKIGYMFPIFNNNRFIVRCGTYWYKSEVSYGIVNGYDWYVGYDYEIKNRYDPIYGTLSSSIGGKISVGFNYLLNYEAYFSIDNVSMSFGLTIGLPF